MGLHRINFVVLTDFLDHPPRLVYIMGLLCFGISIDRLVIGWTVLAIAGFVVMGFCFITSLHHHNIQFCVPSYSVGKKVIKYGLYLYLPFLSIFIIKYMLTLFLGAFSLKQDVSFFAISTSLVSISFLLFTPVSKMLMPTVSRIYAAQDYNKMQVMGKTLTKYIGLANIAIVSIFCFGGTFILRLIYGSAYLDAGGVLIILSLATFFEIFKLITDP